MAESLRAHPLRKAYGGEVIQGFIHGSCGFKYLLCPFHLVSKYCRLRCNFVFQPMGFLVFCITYSDMAIFSSARQFGSVLQGVSYGSGLPQSTATPVWFLTGSCRRYTNIVLTGVPETLFSRWGELRGQGIIQEVCY